MKKGISLICIVAIVFLSGCSFFAMQTDIDGFTKKIKRLVSEKYELTIPDTAIFLDGFWDHGQDSSINMLFTIPKDDLDVLLTDNWEIEISEELGSEKEKGITSWICFDVEGTKFICQYKYENKAYTFLTYSEEVNGIITIAFHGYRP